MPRVKFGRQGSSEGNVLCDSGRYALALGTEKGEVRNLCGKIGDQKYFADFEGTYEIEASRMFERIKLGKSSRSCWKLLFFPFFLPAYF